ncbi:hypothetical protein AB0J55_11260 [Amycolatopsis sp. NPDC049688]|uniref:hypothetical protein n=1 Tax=Amycolatopsis sp. NPDC049688 TaxID=3154733 RepID=UPI00341945ED
MRSSRRGCPVPHGYRPAGVRTGRVPAPRSLRRGSAATGRRYRPTASGVPPAFRLRSRITVVHWVRWHTTQEVSMSSVPEIVPRDFPFPEGTRGKIHDAILRITTSRQGWHGPVESVRIRRVFDGGRSGALVLDVVLRAGSERRQRVVKIGPVAEMVTEFANFRRFLGDYPTAVCAPIQEVTDGARGEGGRPGIEAEAVVYAHVEEYAGRSEVPAVTLEDVVAGAFGSGTAEQLAHGLITALFTAMATPFHNRREVQAERSLRDLNPVLGPDIVIEPGVVTAELTYPEDILQASLEGTENFPPGTPIRLADPAHSAVRVVLSSPSDGPISGVVVSTRFAERRARFDGAFETVERTADAVVADGVRTADPARGLQRVLTDPELGRVRGVVHGDLNGRNVMCVDGRPVLIDFAATTDDQPVLADAAYLEVSLIRDVFAELTYAESVRIQRLLALAGRLSAPGADERLADLLDGRQARIAFGILAKIRSSAARSYPREVVAWRDYLAQVHFTAYRTAKWGPEVQTAAKLRAVHAVAAVATEWLADDDSFAHWPDPDEVLKCVASFADPADPETLDVIAGLVAAADREQPGADVDLREFTDRYVIRYFSAEAREMVLELSREHDWFMGGAPEETPTPLVVAGGAGSGKTTVLRELAYRAAMDIVRPDGGVAGLGMPRLVHARRLLDDTDTGGLPREALALGAIRLLVDGVDEVPAPDRARLFERLDVLHRRFPRARVILAARNPEQAVRMGFEVVRIDPWPPKLAMRYIVDHSSSVVTWSYSRLRQEFRGVEGVTPGLLTMYLDVLRERRTFVALTDVYHEYFVALLDGLDPSELVRAAEVSVGADGPVAPPAGTDDFVARGVLRREGGEIHFAQGIERDFFAAMSLTEASEATLRERARSFAWRPITLLAAQLPEVPDDVLETIVRATGDGDPEFAARLLRRRPSVPYCREFVQAQSAALGDPARGRFTALRALRALGILGTPDALRQLMGQLTAQAASPELLRAALDALTGRSPSKPEDFAVPEEWLRNLLGELLDANSPRETRLAVIRVVKDERVRGLDLMLAGLVTGLDDEVAQAADDALAALDVVLPSSLRSRRPGLAAARLADIERVLPTMSVDAEIQAARADRLRQLERLDDPAFWSERLYSYGIRHDVADRVDGLFDGPVDLSEVRHLGAMEVGAANILAHRILAEHPRLRDELVFAADRGSPTSVLLIAAAAVGSPTTVWIAAKLVTELAEHDRGERIEGLAALAHAIVQADPATGFRISRDAASRLQDRAVAARLHWPWITMLAHTRPAPEELDVLLAAGDVRAIAEVATACTAFDGAPPDPLEFGEAACRFLLADRSGDPVVRALALCAAGLPQGLTEITELIADRSLGATASTISSGRYGLVEVAPLGEILPAYGQLARRSGKGDAARRLLADFHPAGLHASVAEGKAIALGYLGDWIPLVEAASGDGGRLDTAARHTVREWVPGPATPAGLGEPVAVASWLKQRLADAALSPGRRSLAEELLFEVERQHGALLPDQR